MNNSWNRFIYACWAPIYDWFISATPFARARFQGLSALDLHDGDQLLIVGVGTGADLSLLDASTSVVGVDLSLPMLRRAARNAGAHRLQTALIVADAAQLPLPAATFDAVWLSLILSVVPDPRSCLAEVARVAKPNCRVVVFDKFLHSRQPPLLRRWMNGMTRLFGTDINRDFDDILTGLPFRVVSREAAAFRKAYELIELRHDSCSDDSA